MADIVSWRDRKLALAILDSPELGAALMTNSAGETSAMVPRGRPSLSLSLQVPGLNSAGSTTTSAATSPLKVVLLIASGPMPRSLVPIRDLGELFQALSGCLRGCGSPELHELGVHALASELFGLLVNVLCYWPDVGCAGVVSWSRHKER